MYLLAQRAEEVVYCTHAGNTSHGSATTQKGTVQNATGPGHRIPRACVAKNEVGLSGGLSDQKTAEVLDLWLTEIGRALPLSH